MNKTINEMLAEAETAEVPTSTQDRGKYAQYLPVIDTLRGRGFGPRHILEFLQQRGALKDVRPSTFRVALNNIQSRREARKAKTSGLTAGE